MVLASEEFEFQFVAGVPGLPGSLPGMAQRRCSGSSRHDRLDAPARDAKKAFKPVSPYKKPYMVRDLLEPSSGFLKACR